MNCTWTDLCRLIPDSGSVIPWEAWERSILGTYLAQMRATPQNPEWHGEGNVLAHTKLVCDALVADPMYQACTRLQKELLFTAALLHDIGKVTCTETGGGTITSPGHGKAGAKMARHILWEECGLAGTSETIAFREAVCFLIHSHGKPQHLGEREDPERELVKISAVGEINPMFTLRALLLLARADARGRVAKDRAQTEEHVEFAFALAEDLGIMDRPYSFPDSATRYAYLTGAEIARNYPFYDATWGEVIMLSGLPGAGKDFYIATHFAHLPVISLDDIRKELNISPADKEGQGAVVQTAKGRARTYLRTRRSFVWNATCLTAQLRRGLAEMFKRYGARTRIIYLETPLLTELERNRNRARVVPEDVIRKMLTKVEPPLPHEAHQVEWIAN